MLYMPVSAKSRMLNKNNHTMYQELEVNHSKGKYYVYLLCENQDVNFIISKKSLKDPINFQSHLEHPIDISNLDNPKYFDGDPSDLLEIKSHLADFEASCRRHDLLPKQEEQKSHQPPQETPQVDEPELKGIDAANFVSWVPDVLSPSDARNFDDLRVNNDSDMNVRPRVLGELPLTDASNFVNWVSDAPVDAAFDYLRKNNDSDMFDRPCELDVLPMVAVAAPSFEEPLPKLEEQKAPQSAQQKTRFHQIAEEIYANREQWYQEALSAEFGRSADKLLQRKIEQFLQQKYSCTLIEVLGDPNARKIFEKSTVLKPIKERILHPVEELAERRHRHAQAIARLGVVCVRVKVPRDNDRPLPHGVVDVENFFRGRRH